MISLIRWAARRLEFVEDAASLLRRRLLARAAMLEISLRVGTPDGNSSFHAPAPAHVVAKIEMDREAALADMLVGRPKAEHLLRADARARWDEWDRSVGRKAGR